MDSKNMFQVDFSNPEKLEQFLLDHEVTCCVFCIVERQTDACEMTWNEIRETNIHLVHVASYLCNKLAIKFIHLSTDYVFDGSTQPNFPCSQTNPLQNYGISKLISECRVLTNCVNSCIIRTPVLYSPLGALHENAVCLIAKSIMDLRKSRVFEEDNYCVRRPLYVADLCAFICECIFRGNRTGVYHFYNPHNKLTKYEICRLIGEYLELTVEQVTPNNSAGSGTAARPFDTQLADERLDIGLYTFTSLDASIEQCFGRYKHPMMNATNHCEFFLMIDMDGTILSSNDAHYRAYQKCFDARSMQFMSLTEWNDTIENSNIDTYLHAVFDDENMIGLIKDEKRRLLRDEPVAFTRNSDGFLMFLIQNDYNFCIVTNTNVETVNIFKDKLPLLKEVKQWIYRGDYINPKPSAECYQLAIHTYYKGERYVVGVEDSAVGYDALKNITDIIYIHRNERLFKTHDGYLFDDFAQIYFSQ